MARRIFSVIPSLTPLLFFTHCSDVGVTSYNTSPSVTITSPEDGSTFTEGESVTFEAIAIDTEDDNEELLAEWKSDKDGTLDTTPPDSYGNLSFSSISLSKNSHLISLRITDSSGFSVVESITVQIIAPNTPPDVTILSPETGLIFTEGESITFSGQATDEEDDPTDIAIEWLSDLQGLLHSGNPDSRGNTIFTTSSLVTGTHIVTLLATDTYGDSSETYTSLTVREENTPPVSTITGPSETTFREGETIHFTGTATDDQDISPLLLVEWTSNIDGSLFSQFPDSYGDVEFVTSTLSQGIHLVTMRVTDMEGAFDTDTIIITIQAPNTPPTAPVISLTPSDPTSSSDITVDILTDSTDPDGDSVVYFYEWYRDGSLMSGYYNIVTSSATTRGESWRCVVTPYDGYDYGTGAEDEVVIGNSPPSITSASLSPASAYESSTLSVSPSGWSDEDSDPATYTYDWYLNSVEVSGYGSSSITGTYFDKGDTLYCTVTPYDGFEYGTAVNSSTVTILNTPPGAPDIEISPSSPTIEDDLTLTIVTGSSDDDGDAITYSYTWYQNGEEVSGLTGSTVPSSYLMVGDEWECVVEPYDGEDYGTSESAAATIVESAGIVIITEIMYNPAAVTDTNGEWFELYNTTSGDIDLWEWTISDEGGESHTISESLLIPAADHVVLSINDSVLTNGGVPVDYEYSSFLLDNSGDEIILADPDGETIDRVDYGTSGLFPYLEGASLSLSPDSYDHISNNSYLAWCPASSSLPAGDLGTPGEGNDSCDCYGTDSDSDGYTLCDWPEEDCDDGDASTYPGANEICDGSDNDCDGSADEDFDSDGDGYTTCDSPADCDDASASIYPGASEACDDYDNDCDGTYNEGFGDSYEENDTSPGYYYGSIINSSVSFLGTIHSPDDIDIFRFYTEDDMISTWEITVYLEDIPSGSDYDLELWKMDDAYSTTGTLVAVSMNSGNTDESLDWSGNLYTDDSAYYEVWVYPYSGFECSVEYTLTISGG